MGITRRQFPYSIPAAGAGMSWPVAFHLTWLPGYDVFIVTESADCPDLFGYCDRALGRFGPGTPQESGVKDIIRRDWRRADRSDAEEYWAQFMFTGLVDEATAAGWAQEVWGDLEAPCGDDPWEVA